MIGHSDRHRQCKEYVEDREQDKALAQRLDVGEGKHTHHDGQNEQQSWTRAEQRHRRTDRHKQREQRRERELDGQRFRMSHILPPFCFALLRLRGGKKTYREVRRARRKKSYTLTGGLPCV